MSRQHAFQQAATVPQQPHSRTHRCYSVEQLLVALDMPRSTFFHLRKKGLLPFLQELKPRLGHIIRYRADLIDRYLAGQWQQPRAFSSVRRPHVSDSAARQTSTVNPQFGQSSFKGDR